MLICQIAGHGNGLDMGSKYRGLLLAEYGDTSFVSFIKWLVSKIDKVGISYEIP